MSFIIKFAILTLPLFGLGIFIEGKFISQSHIAACLIVFIFSLGLLNSHYKIRKQHITWMKPFVLFLGVGILGLLTSPYGTAAWPKGAIQIGGITIMLLLALSIVLTVYQTPGFVLSLVRITAIGLGIFSAIGIAQFVLWNLSPWDDLLNFSFMNDFAGGTVWSNPGNIGGIYRASSFSAEPSHFIRYLGFGLGVGLIRIGLLGKNMKDKIAPVVPLSVSWLIIIGFIVSVSILGLVLMFLTIMILFFLGEYIKAKHILRAFLLVSIIFVGFAAISMMTGGQFKEKISTIKLIFSSSDTASYKIRSYNSSALTILANREVVKHNFLSNPLLGGGLGSHPLAYEIFSPLPVFVSRIEGINAQDAASLLLRLISETGFLGTCLFIGGVFGILIRAKKALQIKTIGKGMGPLTVSAIGIVASCASIFLIYVIRTGHYYDLLFWSLIGLTVSVPYIVNIERKVQTITYRKYFESRNLVQQT